MGKKKRKRRVWVEDAVSMIAAGMIILSLGGSGVLWFLGQGTTKDVESKVSEEEVSAAIAQAEEGLIEEEDGAEEQLLDGDIVVTQGGVTLQQPEETEESLEDGEYIFPNSDKVYLTEEEVAVRSKEELRIGRNEIMARHGRIFDSEDLKTYFESQSWYKGRITPAEFSANAGTILNDVEKANIEFIEKYE